MKNANFLKEYYTDSQKAMRWRSDTEYKLLERITVLYSILAGAVLTISNLITDATTLMLFIVSIVILLIIFSFIIGCSIYHEHQIYENIGQSVVRVWEYFQLFEKGKYLLDKEILSEKAKEYGKGKGYLGSLFILSFITFAALIFILFMGKEMMQKIKKQESTLSPELQFKMDFKSGPINLSPTIIPSPNSHK